MFATQDLNPGDVLFVERAFATLGLNYYYYLVCLETFLKK